MREMQEMVDFLATEGLFLQRLLNLQQQTARYVTSLKGASFVLGLSTHATRRLLGNGFLEGYKCGGNLFIYLESLADYQQGCQKEMEDWQEQRCASRYQEVAYA